MKIVLPEHVKKIIDTLMAHGFEAYAVGGCVRDTMLGRTPQDWDITTSAKPGEVKELFSHTIDTGIQHGTVTILLDHIGYEVTTYRIDGEYEDARHPKEVLFTSNLLEDLKRRDFTINAMAYNDVAGLVDAFDGEGDLKRGIVRCVGNATERFTEDALRMLRAVRFCAQLGFSMEDSTRDAICKLAPNIAKISAERIQVELVKLLVSPHPEEIRSAYETGLTKVFLPEFDKMMETEQRNKHHRYTVGEHTIVALQQIKADKVLRLTMLFHDVAKPVCLTMDEKGNAHFHGHPKKGAQMAKGIMRRLKFDNETTDAVVRLVTCHDDNPVLEEKEIRFAIFRNGEAQYPNLFAVKRADIAAQSDYHREEKIDYVNQYEAMYDSIIEKKQCLSLKSLAVTGSDLIQAGMKPGKELGEMLQLLLHQVLEHPEWNQKETLLELYQKQNRS